MHQFLRVVLCIAILCAVSSGQKSGKAVEIVPSSGYTGLNFENSSELQTVLNTVINEVLTAYPAGSFKSEDIAATLIDLRDPKSLRWAIPV